VADYLGRLAKLEEELGLPGCVCDGRRESLVILNEIDGPPAAELREVEDRSRWNCPVHGDSAVALLVRVRLSGGRRRSAQSYGAAGEIHES
jgi:hypothetical protein